MVASLHEETPHEDPPPNSKDGSPNQSPLKFRPVFVRSCRLRCPRCGQGKLFAGWFRMLPKCEACGLDLLREPGFYLGSIYFNYGLTCVIALGAFLVLYLVYGVSPDVLLWPLTAFCVVFPVLFFRHARALWLGMDVWLDRSRQVK